MKTELTQNIFGEKRYYQIVNDGVKLETNITGTYSMQTVKFENIGFEEHLVTYNISPVKMGLIVSVFVNFLFLFIVLSFSFPDLLTAVGIISAILIISSFVGLIAYAKQGFKVQKTKFIKGPVNIMFLYFDRYKNDVDEFIESIKVARKAFFRNKYLKIEAFESAASSQQKIAWLKACDHITEAEYIEWMAYIEAVKS